MSAGRFSLTALLALAGACALHAQEPFDDPQLVSIRVQLGVGDKQPTRWDGKLSVSGGEPAGLASLRPRPDDSIAGASWEMASWQGPNFRYPPTKPQPVTGIPVNIFSPGLVAAVRSRGRTRVAFETEQGNFRVDLRNLPLGRTQRFLGGRAVVDRTLATQKISGARASKRLCVHNQRTGRAVMGRLDRLPRRGERSPAAPLRRALLGRDRNGDRKARRRFPGESRARRRRPHPGSLVRPGRRQPRPLCAQPRRGSLVGGRAPHERCRTGPLPQRGDGFRGARLGRVARVPRRPLRHLRAPPRRRTVVARGKSLYVSSQRLGAGGRRRRQRQRLRRLGHLRQGQLRPS